MGTWGSHPFAGDGAQDLIDFMAKRNDKERRKEFHEIFEAAPHAGQPHVDVFPEDIVAAALLIALSVPGSSQRLDEPTRTRPATASSPTSTPTWRPRP
ncbi:DUF4259 domain-containing protein [Dactylosporangium sp. NPDC049525]|uniref:DUF4259 domain-containing protein n=1 Tax=Dactylosporangium sp. NPDC049525 TaxID=3154730 RepID=UPI003439921E